MPQPAPQLINTFRCNQRWDDMMPTSTGRFCDTCRKEVRDFTGMAPELVLQVLQENKGSVCGRIEASKAEYLPELHQPPQLKVLQHPMRWYKMAAAAVTAFLMLVAGKASGQDTTPQKTVVTPFGTFIHSADSVAAEEKPVVNDTASHVVLKGKVTDDATGEAIPFANVIAGLKGIQIAGVSADLDGLYEIKIDPAKLKGKPVDVEVSYIGYAKKRITGVTLHADLHRILDIKLSSDFQNLTVGVFISAPVPASEPGTRIITKEEIQRSPYR